MKKVIFGVLGLGTAISLVIVMSCGSSGGSSGGPATADSAIAGSAVTAMVMGSGGLLSVDSGNNNNNSYSYTYDCADFTDGKSGTIDVTAEYAFDGTTYTFDGLETLNDCTGTDTLCDFGDVVGNGDIEWKANITTDEQSAQAFSLTLTALDALDAANYPKITKILSFLIKDKTLKCAIALTYNFNSSMTTEAEIEAAMTGTVCGADWKLTIDAINGDAASKTALCATWTPAEVK